jgi:hypothetical protein
MGHPPRIPVWLKWEQPVIYFLTFCVARRQKVLATDRAFAAFKAAITRFIRQDLKAVWQWQPGSFDRLLRSDESAEQKWQYIRENPVRAGLVQGSGDWPYRIGFEL